jgi:hypothetical protein
MNQVKDYRKIPKRSLILPELIPLTIPDFYKHSEPIVPNVLSFQKIDSEQWFNSLVDLVVSKIGKEYLPVMRMSDGEYIFLLGHIYPHYEGHTLVKYIKKVLSIAKQKLNSKKEFQASTLPGVSSGSYLVHEINGQKKKIADQIKFIAQHGVLALHLTYGINPFQEHYHYPLKKWFSKNQIELNQHNCFPFYFVYALLRGSNKKKLFVDKSVIVFHSAKGIKREKIEKSLLKEGVKEIIWYEISASRSMFDEIDFKPEHFNADIALVGAGVGKFNILEQLKALNIPCIDAGFVFEVWADENNKWKRPIMVPDWEWVDEKIEFK